MDSIEIQRDGTTEVASASDDRVHVGPLGPREMGRWLAALEREAGSRYVGCRLYTFDVTTADQFHAVNRCRDYIAAIQDRVARGEGLLFLGTVGTGKDHLAFAVARGAIVRGYSAAWFDGLRWYARMRDRIQLAQLGKGSLESEEFARLLEPTLLVLSDPLPPNGDLSDYEGRSLFHLVHRRYIEKKPTLLTVNLASEDQGRDLIGDQAWDRLIEGAELVWCQWPSHRRPRPPPAQ